MSYCNRPPLFFTIIGGIVLVQSGCRIEVDAEAGKSNAEDDTGNIVTWETEVDSEWQEEAASPDDTEPVTDEEEDDSEVRGSDVDTEVSDTEEAETAYDPVDPRALSRGAVTLLYDASRYLYTGAHPRQKEASPDAVTVRRVSVLRGEVTDQAGAAIEGVKISVLGKGEFGHTFTDEEGAFAMAVSGGDKLTVSYEGAGYLPVQRSIRPRVQDYALLPEVVMIAASETATDMLLDGSGDGAQAATGETVSDSAGERRAVALFPPETSGVAVMKDGTEKPLTRGHLRMTEYTVGVHKAKSVPGTTPATSNTGYAVALNFDEAEAMGAVSVRFDRPVSFYVDNYLGLPVGAAVPVGYLDRQKGNWVPSETGRVISILESGGIDLDGEGTAESDETLGAYGIAEWERAQMALTFAAGQSYLRVTMSHFSDWHASWSFTLPEDAVPPTLSPLTENPAESCCKTPAPVIHRETQTLEERFPVVGTPYHLVYMSDRVEGRKSGDVLTIPLGGDTLPESLKRIDLEIDVAGVAAARESFPPASNQTHTFVWNGRDAEGRRPQGAVPAEVRVGYVYDGFAQKSVAYGNPAGEGVMTGEVMPEEKTLWRKTVHYLGQTRLPVAELGGLSIDVHHRYDPVSKMLHFGTGERTPGMRGNHGHTVKTVRNFGLKALPHPVANGLGGSVLFGDIDKDRVVRLFQDGTEQHVAGAGQGKSLGDGGPAIDASFQTISGIVEDTDGTIYISDEYAEVIRRITPDGIIHTVAGGDKNAPTVEGVPALEAKLDSNRAITLGAGGGLYIQERTLLRYLSADGMLRHVAGGGGTVPTVAGVSPLEANLGSLQDITPSPDGGLYLASRYVTEIDGEVTYVSRVFKMETSGRIRLIAGGEEKGVFGDPLRTFLPNLQSIAAAEDGRLFLADLDGRIDYLDTDGLLKHHAGCGDKSSCGEGYRDRGGDDNPAEESYLGLIRDIAVNPEGELFFSDGSGRRVRKVTSPMPGISPSDHLIPSPDGGEVYRFDYQGKHLETLHPLTGSALRTFHYNAQGVLTGIEEDDHTTQIKRGGDGSPSAVISPFGQATRLTVTDNHATEIRYPDGTSDKLQYNTGGLVTAFEDRKGHTSRFAYDDMGRLISDTDPVENKANRSKTLTKADENVTFSSAEGVETIFHRHIDNENALVREITLPNGLKVESVTNADTSVTAFQPDGTRIETRVESDPIFGMNAPLVTVETATPGGLKKETATGRTVSPSTREDYFDIDRITETKTVNGRTTTHVFDADEMTWTTTTPMGRTATETIDELGRLIETQMGDDYPVTIAYDGYGRIETTTQGTEENARVMRYEYDQNGFLEKTVDSLGRETLYINDAAGKPIVQTLPDGREIGYVYDANGNLIEMTPPGKPTHIFEHTEVDLMAAYTPPETEDISSPETRYTYNLDRQPMQIIRPDGQTVEYVYDTAGRVAAIHLGDETITYTHDPNTGHEHSVTSPDNITLTNEYDGALVTHITYTGAIKGEIAQTHDDNFRVTKRTVDESHEVDFIYDDDGLLEVAGDLALFRDDETGRTIATEIGSVTSETAYNRFGETVTETHKQEDDIIFESAYERDALGRITSKTETVSGATTQYSYEYDLAGRLTAVYVNGGDAPVTEYSYDTNGNRLSHQDYRSGSAVVNNGSFDAQDRMESYGNASDGYTKFTYSDNGELKTKTLNGDVTAYDYDVLGNLRSVDLPNGTAIDYIIDGENRRIGKMVDGVLEMGLLYKDALNPIAELDGSGNVVSRFVYGSKFNVPDYFTSNKADGSTWVTYRII
ncbi:MAG: hypothetical protein PVH19_10075, partial [Planctomycetia bacterium]